MIRVSITNFKKNLSYYLKVAEREDVYVFKRGEPYTLVQGSKRKAFEEFFKLEGCMADPKYDGRDYKDIIGDVILEKNGIDPSKC